MSMCNSYFKSSKLWIQNMTLQRKKEIIKKNKINIQKKYGIDVTLTTQNTYHLQQILFSVR